MGGGHRDDFDAAPGGALGDRPAQRTVRGDRVLGYRDRDRARAHRIGSRERAVEHELRAELEQGAVLGAHRLSLGGVHEQSPRTAAARYLLHLHRGGERRAPAPAQAGLGNVLQEVARRPAFRPMDAAVLVERQRHAPAHAREQAGQAHWRAAPTGTPRSAPLTAFPLSESWIESSSARPSALPTSAWRAVS